MEIIILGIIVLAVLWGINVIVTSWTFGSVLKRSKQGMQGFRKIIPEGYRYLHYFDNTGIAVNEQEKKIFLLTKGAYKLIWDIDNVSWAHIFFKNMNQDEKSYEQTGFFFRQKGVSTQYQVMVGSELDFTQTKVALKGVLNKDSVFTKHF